MHLHMNGDDGHVTKDTQQQDRCLENSLDKPLEDHVTQHVEQGQNVLQVTG